MPTSARPRSTPARRSKNTRFHDGDRLYGTATIGERGQIVIPAEARKDFGLAPGDQVIALGNKVGKVLMFVKADSLGEFANMVLSHLTGTKDEKNLKHHFTKLLKSSEKITLKRTKRR